jgi:transposase
VAWTGRPKAELVLSDDERAALEGWVRRRSTPQSWALRCRIILACATGASNKDVAAQLGATPHAVGRWRARLVMHRIAGLGDMPRPGGPRTVSEQQVADLVAKTLERTPKDATHWSTRSMTKEAGLATGKVIGSLHRRHRAEEFKTFLTKLDKQVPDGLDVHLVLDNYAAHKTPAIKTWSSGRSPS